ncbi:MAG TPA: DNA mismatch repair endonuclease MutL [Terriglobia bacterium]|nr:DNA mismatch repair endonuclease MutL [Terriglobia bacterium]
MIHILPEAVANKIAAGEVVERPSSVVKELLENALDAGAGRIEVHVEAGGRRLIRVEDDGVGMTRDDAMLAFERHATSKIRSVEDLFEVATLGFRGEALPSIASVSRVTLETRHASEAAGTQLEIHGGRLRDVKEIARAEGTRFEASGLFYNTPARRKFLKSESTELGHITSLVTHYALAHPEKSFRLTSMTHEILSAPPAESFRQRLYQVMGAQTIEQLVEIAPAARAMPAESQFEEETESAEAAPPARVSLFGFISRPEVQKINRNQIYFFVNRRLVRDRLILHAITEAYRNILPSGAFPVALIFLDLPPGEVDVNVHPAKTEVKFRHSNFIHDFARDVIRRTLVASRPMAAFPSPKAAGASAFHPGAAVEETRQVRRGDVLGSNGAGPQSAAGLGWHEPPSGEIAGRELQSSRAYRLSPLYPPPRTGLLPLERGVPAVPGSTGGATTAQEADFTRKVEEYSTAVGASADEFPKGLRPLGQVRESFIVATNDEGLWIIDQHVAHERVLFEQRLRGIREKSIDCQRLLLPVVVELKPEQQVVFQDIAQELAANGFEAEPFGQRTIAIKSAPAEIRAEAAERLLIAILDGVGAEGPGLSLDDLRHRVAATVACHAAVKVNMPLSADKMEWLLGELEKTDCPMSCPHGRPILLRYSLREIQKAFKRI